MFQNETYLVLLPTFLSLFVFYTQILLISLSFFHVIILGHDI